MSGFISCDWGTSALRLQYVSLGDLNILAGEASGDGIGSVFNAWKQAHKKEEERFEFYAAVLKEKIKLLEQRLGTSLDGVPLVVSGMASSSIGMMEMPYKKLPFFIEGSDLLIKHIERTQNFPYDLFIISGVQTEDDVMRGEETQLVGSADGSDEEQLFIFPGTHSKHVWIKERQVKTFRTYMTGEFFELLVTKSILANSVAQPLASQMHVGAFHEGVKEARFNLLHSAFRVRTNYLFNRLSKDENYFYLSGLLIGNELKDVPPSSAKINLVGKEDLCLYYEKALQFLQPHRHVNIINANEATIKGQFNIYSSAKIKT